MNRIVSMDEIAPLIKEQLHNGGNVSFTPKGNSMLPLFRNNKDIVTLVKPVFPLKKYDIVLYQRDNGNYVLHRIVALENDSYVMRGDNQFRNERGISKEQIIAKVSSFQRKGRAVSCMSGRYRIYSFLWTNTVKIRKELRIFRRVAGKVKRRILRIFR